MNNPRKTQSTKPTEIQTQQQIGTIKGKILTLLEFSASPFSVSLTAMASLCPPSYDDWNCHGMAQAAINNQGPKLSLSHLLKLGGFQ
jgi:hypothetical protein